MPDISKCKGRDCPLKESCYRYKVKSGERQSYFVEVPYDEQKKTCEYYWEIEE